MALRPILPLTLVLLLTVGCATPGGSGDAGRSEAADHEVRIVTALSRLPTSTEVSVHVPDDGYLTVFELRPGRALAMIYPPRDGLERGDGGRIVAAEADAGRVEAGTHTLLRPDRRPRFQSTLGRMDMDRHSLGPDVLSYPYYCATTTPRSFGRWLLAVWSPEPLHPEKLWPRRADACGEPVPAIMAERVTKRLLGSEDQIARLDLVEY